MPDMLPGPAVWGSPARAAAVQRSGSQPAARMWEAGGRVGAHVRKAKPAWLMSPNLISPAKYFLESSSEGSRMVA